MAAAPELSLAGHTSSVAADDGILRLSRSGVVLSHDDVESLLAERLQLAIERAVTHAAVSDFVNLWISKQGSIDRILRSIRSAHAALSRISGSEELEDILGSSDPLDVLEYEALSAANLVAGVESMLEKREESWNVAKKEMEDSIVRLTEENRDVGSLLRTAITEKEAVERSMNKLKGGGDQRKGAILQIAERVGLGFGFMAGSVAVASGEPQFEASGGSTDSNARKEEEETISLASLVENMMKNQRLEIANLKESLDKSRSDCMHLQSLSQKQAERISELVLCIKILEEKESMLVHNVEELTIELREAEEDATRWKEACELEVAAGKCALQECETKVAILMDELERRRAELVVVNKKVKMKENLATTAMAAQQAAEATLQLADSRAAELRECIEELTRQIEEEANRTARKERHIISIKGVRHACWPWRRFTLFMPPPAAASRSACKRRPSRMLPEMETLLHFNV